MTANDSLPTPETGRRVDRLDGNAAGGPLSEIFGVDLTAAVIECGQCGRTGAVAETIVELDHDGMVIICRGCEHQLLSCVLVGSQRRLRFSHVATMIIESAGDG